MFKNNFVLTFCYTKGCDTGFGNLLAEQLDAKGFTVFASCLDAESKGAQHLVNTCSKRLKVFKLDVTKDEEVKEAVLFLKNNLQNNSEFCNKRQQLLIK